MPHAPCPQATTTPSDWMRQAPARQVFRRGAPGLAMQAMHGMGDSSEAFGAFACVVVMVDGDVGWREIGREGKAGGGGGQKRTGEVTDTCRYKRLHARIVPWIVSKKRGDPHLPCMHACSQQKPGKSSIKDQAQLDRRRWRLYFQSET